VIRRFDRWMLVEYALPWIVLATLVTFTYGVFVQIPYAGFEFAGETISTIFSPPEKLDSIQVDDRLIEVGSVPWDEFQNDLRLRLFDKAVPGDIVTLIVERGGQVLSVDWEYPGPTLREILERLGSQWWMAYVFWLAGTATALFIRPRDTRWLLLVAFNFITAIWLAAGSGPSHWHIGESAIVLRAAVWMCVPVYLHFHWVFPKPFKRLPAFIWGALYVLAGVLALAQWFQIPSQTTFYWGFLLAVIVSLLLLVAHFILQPTYRRDVLLLIGGSALVFLPLLGVGIARLLGAQPSIFVQGGAFLAVPAIPGAYFYAVYRRQLGGMERRARRLVIVYLLAIMLGTLLILLISLFSSRLDLEGSLLPYAFASVLLAGIIAITSFFPFISLPALVGSSFDHNRDPGQLELRANRLISLYLFLILVGLAYSSLIFLIDIWLDFTGDVSIFGVATALSVGIITALGYAPFQRFVEHRILGMPLPPRHLLETYSDKITTSLDSTNLVHLLRDEILPSLLIRQSALLNLTESNTIETIYTTGVIEDHMPRVRDQNSLVEWYGNYSTSRTEGQESKNSQWIRVVLPLEVDEELIGLWLLGRRDPDDVYTQTEISVLKTIANQTAIALINIAQSRNLRKLYQANVERQEKERKDLARDLHDDILNQLAALVMNVDEQHTTPTFLASYRTLTKHIRKIIKGLRPAMLDYGLWHALNELAVELSDRVNKDLNIQMAIPISEIRYDAKVEEHLYRIVQQACENALHHAHAKTIRIDGELEKEQVNLIIEDDGVGIESHQYLDNDQLLANKRYGLVGMRERSEIIGADIQIKTTSEHGTRVSLTWRPPRKS
jgi:signal transduction histidine kinase